MTAAENLVAGDPDTEQVRALRALEALIAVHEVADAGTECQSCPGQQYPCETRLHAEESADRLRHRINSPRRPATGQPKHLGAPVIETKGVTVDPDRATWRKSSFSDNSGGNCVEVAEFPGAMAVRDSKSPDGGVLVFTRAEWQAFIGGVKDGEFDQ